MCTGLRKRYFLQLLCCNIMNHLADTPWAPENFSRSAGWQVKTCKVIVSEGDFMTKGEEENDIAACNRHMKDANLLCIDTDLDTLLPRAFRKTRLHKCFWN